MRRFLFYLIPGLILLSSVVIMIGGPYLKKADGADDLFNGYAEALAGAINDDRWEAAAAYLEKLNTVWKKVLPRLQFSIDRDEAIQIGIRFARLKGALAGRDPAAALVELYELKERWHNLTE